MEYEDISGNPLRDTNKSTPDSSESAESDTERESTEKGDGAPSCPDGDEKAPDGSPTGPSGDPPGSDGDPDGPNGAPSAHTGDPTGPDEAPAAPDGDPSSTAAEAREPSPSAEEGGEDHPRMPSGRKRRVKVTPRDWTVLEETARKLGVGHAKVYRIALQYLRRHLDD